MINSIDLDFQYIHTYDPKAMLIADSSHWGNIEDEPAIIEITTPGSSTPIVHYFLKNKINKFDSLNLMLSQEETKELPDGLYSITIKGSPDTFNKQKYVLRTENLQLRLDKAYSSFGIDISEVENYKLETLWNVKLLIEGALSSIRLGYLDRAIKFYQEADRIIKSYNNCDNC